jgi:hypothetical protein
VDDVAEKLFVRRARRGGGNVMKYWPALAVVASLLSSGSHAGEASLEQKMNLQERCSKQARLEFSQSGYDELKKLESYSSHYNAKMERCLIRIDSRDGVSVVAIVEDAFERRVFASYFWTNPTGKKYWEVKPSTCEFYPLGQPKQVCDSIEEFDAFSEILMNN